MAVRCRARSGTGLSQEPRPNRTQQYTPEDRRRAMPPTRVARTRRGRRVGAELKLTRTVGVFGTEQLTAQRTAPAP